MTRFEMDWRYVSRRTVVPVASALVAVAVLVVAININTARHAMYDELGVNQSAVQQDYNDLVLRRRLVDRYHARYQQFHELGFVGQESRLDWIETLRHATDDLTLPRLSYAIAPQLDVVAPVQSILAGDDIAINVSKLDLEMALVHELDLVRFIDELQQEAPGLIRIPHCGLVWQNEADEPLRATTNIQASCVVEIFSVITSDVRYEVAQR